jgi:hypothetical protein
MVLWQENCLHWICLSRKSLSVPSGDVTFLLQFDYSDLLWNDEALQTQNTEPDGDI